jgi:hypothetical protein
MIPTFFGSPEALEKLRVASVALIGTPFFPNSEAPGLTGGIDCVHTLNWLFRTCGVIGEIHIPPQTVDHGEHSDQSLLIDAFETWPELKARFARVPDITIDDSSALLPGDALCFISGKVPHHGAVMLQDREILHTLKRPGVHVMQLDAVIRGRAILGLLAAVYRPLPAPHT